MALETVVQTTHGSATMRTCFVYSLLEPGQRVLPRSCPALPLSSPYVQSLTRPRRLLTRRSLALASILSVVVHRAVHTSPRTRGSLESKKAQGLQPSQSPKKLRLKWPGSCSPSRTYDAEFKIVYASANPSPSNSAYWDLLQSLSIFLLPSDALESVYGVSSCAEFASSPMVAAVAVCTSTSRFLPFTSLKLFTLSTL